MLTSNGQPAVYVWSTRGQHNARSQVCSVHLDGVNHRRCEPTTELEAVASVGSHCIVYALETFSPR